MKRKIATLIFGILLIGVVSALIVPYLSNTITGSVTVNGLVFYATGSNNLIINTFDGSSAVYNIIDGKNEVFLTTSFNQPLSFYRPSMNMYVKAEVVNGNVPKNLKLEFGYFDSHGNLNEICSGIVSVNSNDFSVYNIPNCVGSSSLTGVNGFYYRITGMGTPDITCAVSVDGGNTKAEMNKA